MNRLFSLLLISLCTLSSNINAWNLKSGDKICLRSLTYGMYIMENGTCNDCGVCNWPEKKWVVEKVGGNLGDQIYFNDPITLKTVSSNKFLCRGGHEGLRTLSPAQVLNEQKTFKFRDPANEDNNKNAIGADSDTIGPVRLVLDSIDGLAGVAAIHDGMGSCDNECGHLNLWKNDKWEIMKAN